MWWAALHPGPDREQEGCRPVVVVASDGYLEVVDTLAIVVPVTTTGRGTVEPCRLAGELGLGSESWAMTEQPSTVARSRLVRAAGRVDEACLRAIQIRLADFLDL